jgi:hypothetical protein
MTMRAALLHHRIEFTARLLGLGLLWMSGACRGSGPSPAASLRDGESGPPPAALAFYGDTSSIELPSIARVGETVELRFTTFGGSCIRPGRIDVAISDLRAEVRPYLEAPPAELPDTVVCTAELLLDRRVAQLRFDLPGRATVRIVGLAVPEEAPIVLERALQVTP